MTNRRWMVWPIIVFVAASGGFLGSLNYRWSHMPVFPAYGYVIDLLTVPVLVALILLARRLRIVQTDEFTVTKKRIAAATGMMFGMIAFVVLNAVPIIVPHSYHAFLSSLDGTEDAYLMGRFVGMAPFAVGLLIGQIVSWMKYR